MLKTIVLVPLLIAPAPPADVVNVTATVATDALVIGNESHLNVAVAFKDGWTAAGLPGPILQIKTPPSVELVGEEITDPRALARNEFLKAPFERMIEGGSTRVAFKLTDEPAEDERIRFNVLTYVAAGADEDAHFVRRRYELPLKAGATAIEMAATPSDWGRGDELQLGQDAPKFELPRADGSTVKLADALGENPVIVTTYRAFW